MKGKKILYTSIITIIISLTIYVIITTNKINFFQIKGYSMNPTLVEKNLVVSKKTNKYNRGDIIAFTYQGTTMIKRIIALPGETINIEGDGTVFINEKELKEDYIKVKAAGIVETLFPYKVKEKEYYVIGDNRMDSLDSRINAVGCIKESQIIGKVFFSIVPFKKIN